MTDYAPALIDYLKEAGCYSFAGAGAIIRSGTRL